MAKGLRALFERMKESLKQSDRPSTVPFSLPDGTTIDLPATATSSSSANFRTHKVVMEPAGRLSMKKTIGATLFFGAFLLFGTVALVFMLPSTLSETNEDLMSWIGALLCSVVGSVFVVLGMAGLLGYVGAPLAVLDRQVGLYWKGKPPKSIRSWAQPPLALEQIAAVQICSKRVTGENSYTAYEINLVVSDPPGERINLMSHGHRKSIEKDAQKVAEFLGCPVLDHS